MDKETRPEARQAEKPAAKSFVKPAIAVSAFTVGLIYVLFCFDSLMHVGGVLMNALSSLIAGLFIAYILNVFLNLFENFIFGRLTRGTNRFWHRIRRPLCVALSFAVVILILLAIVLYIVPEIFQSLELIGETARVNIPIYVQNVTKWLDQLSVELNLNLENSLAESYEWVDDLTLQLNIREGVTFHNGDPLTAEDVIFTFKQRAESGNAYKEYVDVDNLEAKDDHTVIMPVSYTHLTLPTICSV